MESPTMDGMLRAGGVLRGVPSSHVGLSASYLPPKHLPWTSATYLSIWTALAYQTFCYLRK